jgi:starch synthase
MKIIHIAAEIAPAAKVGGLADVVYGLARAFTLMGNDVAVVIPRYACLKMDAVEEFELHEAFEQYSVWKGRIDGIKIYFIEFPKAFQGSSIYGNPNDHADFIQFSWFAYQWVSRMQPDILHLHDWHVSAIPLFSSGKFKIMGTIHNFEYQGITDNYLLEQKGVNLSQFAGIEQDGSPQHTNLLKALILYSNRVNTVSPTYAHEVAHTSEGRGLQETLRKVEGRFSGILNGIDYDYWNPETDMHLPVHYSLADPAPKRLLKSTLRQRFGLMDTARPLAGIVSRLVQQKGIHLMQHAIDQADRYGIQLILSGSTHDPAMKELFHGLEERFAHNQNVRIVLGYDEALAQLIYGAADMFIIPSLFEPCGLTQLISLRYGTVPIVRHTGGLADTVVDVHAPGKCFSETNGFSFVQPYPEELDSAVFRAVKLWNESPDLWTQLQKQGMAQDFSWKKSAKQYLDLYYTL